MSEEQADEADALASASSPTKKKAKKRPSDFEIVRSILTRTHDRKLPYLLKNMGEDKDVFLLCSQEEDGFAYGSPEISIALLTIEDESLKEAFNGVMAKIYGLQEDHGHQCIINLRDQISDLVKTKGEAMSAQMQTDGQVTWWTVKTDTRGQDRTVYYSLGIVSLYRVQMVKNWCKTYRPWMTKSSHEMLAYPHTHTDPQTASILTLPAPEQTHPMADLYPHGFRSMVTKGFDVLLSQSLVEFPYPIEAEEIIIIPQTGSAVQMAHRIRAQGWTMLLVRPNALFIPTLKTPLPEGSHAL